MRKYLILLTLALNCFFEAVAMNSVIPPALDHFSSTTVFSVIQDSGGAIWLSSSRGVYRYNGHTLEQMHTQLPWIRLASDDRYVYVTSPQSVTRFDIRTLERKEYPSNGPLLTRSVPACDSSGLYLCVQETLFRLLEDGLQRCGKLPKGQKVTAMESMTGGRFVIGTELGAIFVYERDGFRKICEGESGVVALLPLDDRRVWVGRMNCLEKVDIENGQTGERIARCGDEALHNVRSLSKSADGTLFVGTPQGLFSLPPGGEIQRETLLGFHDRPICCLYDDRDGNMWLGTYYDGVRMSNPHAFPYESIPGSSMIQIVKGMAELPNGDVAILTDGHGMWLLHRERNQCSIVPGTYGIKFQNAFYDAERDAVWTGDNNGILYSISGGNIKKYGSAQVNGAILCTFRLGDDLLLGCRGGLFAFNPEKENCISRKIEGFAGNVYDITSEDGVTAWVAGAGIFTYSQKDGVKQQKLDIVDGEWTETVPCSDIEFDKSGKLWLSFSRNGVVCLDKGKTTHFMPEKCGMLDDATSGIAALNDGSVAIATLSGISVLRDGECHNYPAINGMHLLKIDDGNVLIGGNDGIRIVKTSSLSDPFPVHKVVIDHFYVNGKQTNASILKHTDDYFSFDVSTFDFTEVGVTSFFYRLDGYEKQWHRFDIHSPVAFMNMNPGHYTFRVQSRTLAGEVISEDSRSFRIKPVWFATWWAIIMELSIVLSTICAFAFNHRKRERLSEELARKEKESREKTMFFIDMSYSLRTPLNLIIGKLERFFHDFGSRTAGIESIEDIYNKSIHMRSLISGYVDAQNDSLITESTDESTIEVVKDAKFLNAAIGAVERNLYSGKLDISTLCSELSIGKTALTKKIEDVTGMTPRAFIEDIRLKHAAQMLMDGSHRVAEIADLLGFSSQNHFSQRFKLKYGESPKEYARKIREDRT